MELIKLIAFKEKVTNGLYKGCYETKIYKLNGELFVTFPPEHEQPRRGTKVLTINCFKWEIEWRRKDKFGLYQI